MAGNTPSTVIEVNALIHRLKLARRSGCSRPIKVGTRREKLARWRELDAQIQALPQELQDIIFHFTIHRPIKENTVHITEQYNPPIGLQLSWHTRAAFVKVYYGDTIFQLGSSEHRWKIDDVSKIAPCILARSWLASLVASERDLINTIRTDFGPRRTPTTHANIVNRRRALGDIAQFIISNLNGAPNSHTGLNLRPDVLVIRLPTEGGEEWHRCAGLSVRQFQHFRSLRPDWSLNWLKWRQSQTRSRPVSILARDIPP